MAGSFLLMITLLLIFSLLFLFNRRRLKVIIGKNKVQVMRGKKLIKLGVIQPLTSNEQLECFLESFEMELSVELIFSKDSEQRFIYLYHSPHIIASHLNIQPIFDSSKIFLSILGGKPFKKASPVKNENMVCLSNDATSSFFLAMLTFIPSSSQQLLDLIEKLRAIPKMFRVNVHLILPIKPRPHRNRLTKVHVSVNRGDSVELFPYIVILSNTSDSIKEAVVWIKSILQPHFNMFFAHNRLILKNLLKISCRLYTSKHCKLVLNSLEFFDKILEAKHIRTPLTQTINLGRLIIRDRRISLKVKEDLLRPSLILVKNPSTPAFILNTLSSQLPYKWLVIDLQGITLHLRTLIKNGVFLSKQDELAPFFLVPSSTVSLHEYLTRITEVLAKILGVPCGGNIVRDLIRTTNYGHISALLLDILQTLSKFSPRKEKVNNLLLDVKSGALNILFEEGYPTIEDLLSASIIFMDLNSFSSKLTPTALELLALAIIKLCPEWEFSLLVIAPPQELATLLEEGLIDEALKKHHIVLLSTFNELPLHYHQYFKSLILEIDNETFVLERKGYPSLTFYIPLKKGDVQSPYVTTELEWKLLQLLESFPYVTEDFASRLLEKPRKSIHDALIALRKRDSRIKRIYLPMPNGSYIPIFFFNKSAGTLEKVLSSYVYDVIEKVCNEAGLMLVQAKNPKLGIDGFINNCPFKLVLIEKNKDIEELSQQIERIIEKYGVVLLIFLDKRNTRATLELKKRFSDKIIITYISELNLLPLNFEKLPGVS